MKEEQTCLAPGQSPDADLMRRSTTTSPAPGKGMSLIAATAGVLILLVSLAWFANAPLAASFIQNAKRHGMLQEKQNLVLEAERAGLTPKHVQQ